MENRERPLSAEELVGRIEAFARVIKLFARCIYYIIIIAAIVEAGLYLSCPTVLYNDFCVHSAKVPDSIYLFIVFLGIKEMIHGITYIKES